MLTKKVTRCGKMSCVTRLINVVNEQVLDKSEARQAEHNLQSIKKAMANFQESNDEYVAVLEDSGEIEGIFESIINTEDSFQQCISKAEKYLSDSEIEQELERFSQKSGKYSKTSPRTEEENCDKQDPVRR